jgi:hypothetical protein
VALVDRARAIITQPAETWSVIAAETATPADIFRGYIVPLALIAPVCTFLSTILFSHRSIVIALIVAVVAFVLELVNVVIVAFIVNALAPSFGAAQDRVAALKLVAYSYTPRWIAGIATLLPVVGALLVLVATLYGLYLMYLGIPPVMKVPQERAVGYTLVVVVAAIVLGAVVAIVAGILLAALTVSAIVTSPLVH